MKARLGIEKNLGKIYENPVKEARGCGGGLCNATDRGSAGLALKQPKARL